MQFRTKVDIQAAEQKIHLQSSVMTIGSCFADVIGAALSGNKFKCLGNPFGVVYNPYSIHKLLRLACLNDDVEPVGYIQHADVHLHYDFHSELSALSKTELATHVRIRISAAHEFIKHAEWLIITYGTAWVYQLNDSKEIVANCHKMPATLFNKQLLSQKKIIESFSDLYEILKQLNPQIKIILTVSPVRHMKDTFQLNNVSKSALLLSCHTLSSQFKDVSYFPAYEIQMDELRDYRFYKADMLHPNEAAEQYIWERFSATYFDTNTTQFLSKWKKINQALQHKAFHRSSSLHQQFLQNLLTELQEISNIVDVYKEIQQVKSQLL